jgi:hypothetical protein
MPTPRHTDNTTTKPNNLRTLCVGALACGLAACGSPAMKRDLAQPLAVTLPLHAARIQDDRTAFAAAFQRELDALSPAGSHPDAAAHLRFAASPASAGAAVQPVAAAPRGVDLKRVSVLIVPGLFGDCVDKQAVPFGDGVERARDEQYTQAYRIYDDLGLAGLRAMQVAGRASSAANAEVVARELVAEARRDDVDAIILIGYSKGVPDFLEAIANLHKQRQLPAKLRAAVSVAGTVMGTPVADRYAGLYDAFSGFLPLFGCHASTGGEMDSLKRTERMAWLASAVLPTTVQYYSVVANAARDDIAPALRLTFDDLSVFDWRNDGQMLTPDAILPNSTLLAEANVDHWNLTLPFDKSTRSLVRELMTARPFPREALLRAIVRTVAAQVPPRP